MDYCQPTPTLTADLTRPSLTNLPTHLIVTLQSPSRAAVASSAVGVNTRSSVNETPEIPDSVEDWLQGLGFATDRNDFRGNLILILGLFAAGVWLARNLSDIDLMASQPGV
ncbi:mitochondrial import receptor subunit TOM6 homolog [Molossus nigricans]